MELLAFLWRIVKKGFHFLTMPGSVVLEMFAVLSALVVDTVETVWESVGVETRIIDHIAVATSYLDELNSAVEQNSLFQFLVDFLALDTLASAVVAFFSGTLVVLGFVFAAVFFPFCLLVSSFLMYKAVTRLISIVTGGFVDP